MIANALAASHRHPVAASPAPGLPGIVDADAVETTPHDGVLTVRVPRPEHARRRQIAVKAD